MTAILVYGGCGATIMAVVSILADLYGLHPIWPAIGGLLVGVALSLAFWPTSPELES